MSTTTSGRAVATGNRFLDALPEAAAQRLVAGAPLRAYPTGTTIVRRGEPIGEVLFPLHGAISEIEEQRDGGAAEVTAVGREGVSGWEALYGVTSAQRLRLVQVPTRALVVPLATIEAVLADTPAFRGLTERYLVLSLRSTGITVACNARHDAVARLARWLLRMHDRAAGDALELTHEVVSIMLGVRRPTVTKAIAVLAESGAIVSTRGTVRVHDRAELERRTCSCYADGRAVTEAFFAGEAARR